MLREGRGVGVRHERTDYGGHAAIYEIEEATENLIAAIRRTGLGEKIVVERRLRAMWEDGNGPERALLAAIMNALELPRSRRMVDNDRTPRPYQKNMGSLVLEAVRNGFDLPSDIAKSLAQTLDTPYTLLLNKRVRDQLGRLLARRRIVRESNGTYRMPKPHPWSQRAVLPKRS